jgi:hypothetical protein
MGGTVMMVGIYGFEKTATGFAATSDLGNTEVLL